MEYLVREEEMGRRGEWRSEYEREVSSLSVVVLDMNRRELVNVSLF